MSEILINPLKSSEKYVYHYTKTETAFRYILKTGTLRLNSFSLVNDPRDSQTWTIVTKIRSDIAIAIAISDWKEISESISHTLKQNVKLVCFSKDNIRAVDKWQIESDGLLGRGFAKPSMWHHYANGHDGVCLVFDIEKLNTTFKKQVKNEQQLISGSVSYSDEGVLTKLSKDPFSVDLTRIESEQQLLVYLSTHLNQWMPNLFFRKLRDWSNEEEYRWIYFDDHKEPIILNFDDALEAIVVGDGVPKDYYDKFRMYCAKYKADIAYMKWRNGFPNLTQLGQPYREHPILE